MQTFAFAMPIIPGMEDVDRENIRRVSAPGPEHDEFVATRRALGITREAVWHQTTPEGTMAVVLMEADDIQAVMGRMATSDDPHMQRFREQVKQVHGVDLANDPPPKVELITDERF
jgi:hypothetical protein